MPFYLRTGKRMAEAGDRDRDPVPRGRHSPVRRGVDRPAAEPPGDPHPADEGILLRFGSKVPGLGLAIRPVTMDFTYGTAFATDAPEAYETLILDAMLGDQSLFTRADEVEAAWSIVTPIHDDWVADPAPRLPELRGRDVGSRGASDLLERDGRRWRRL